MKTRLITSCILVMALFSGLMTGCNKSDAPESAEQKNPIVAAQPSDVAKDPKSTNDMLVSARFLAANSSLLALDGDLAKFKGTLLEGATKTALQESSDIKENYLWPVVSKLSGYEAYPGVVFSTPLGRFVFFEAVHPESGQTYIVGINLETKKASVLEAIGNGHSISSSGVLDAAALWAYRAISTVANYETRNDKTPFQKITKEYQALAVGYLYAVEYFVVEAERRRQAMQQISSAEPPPRNEPQGLVFSGETLRYPKGASEEALIAAVPSMKCMDFEGSRMCTAEVSLLQRVLLDGLPGTCMGGKEVVAVLDKDKRLKTLGCDVAPLVAEAVFNDHQNRFGAPKNETVVTGGMKAVYAEWKVGEDYVLVTNYLGNDFYGKPLNNFNVHISTTPSLPIRK